VLTCAHPCGKDDLPVHHKTRHGYRPSLQYRLIHRAPLKHSAWTSWDGPNPAHWVRRGDDEAVWVRARTGRAGFTYQCDSDTVVVGPMLLGRTLSVEGPDDFPVIAVSCAESPPDKLWNRRMQRCRPSGARER
jgi:hypothetical protein